MASANTVLYISYQVVNETTRVLKKRGFTEQELRQIINSMFLICDVCAFTHDSAKLASELRETMSISYWDSHIAANAILRYDLKGPVNMLDFKVRLLNKTLGKVMSSEFRSGENDSAVELIWENSELITKDKYCEVNIVWQCPKCKREFKNINQDHFCVKISAIDDYIAEQPEEVQPILYKARETIRTAAPDVEERISWRMPTFWQGENLIHFAAFKRHLGIYPGDLSLAPFMDRLEGYHTTKGAIQFPYDKPIDYELIADITRWRVAAVCEKNKPNEKIYEYDETIEPTDKGGAYVIFPYDIREEFGKGRVKVHATFDGEPYEGSVVNMGVKNLDGSVCYIIGIRKHIRAKINKQPGDTVRVTIRERMV